jgi:hypothetical protein
LTTIMAWSTAWGMPTVGELSHHATQSAAPAPNAIMRRSFGTDRGQKQGASPLARRSTTIDGKKIMPPHLHSLITEAHPQERQLVNKPLRRRSVRSAQTKEGQGDAVPVTALYPTCVGDTQRVSPALMKSAHPMLNSQSRPVSVEVPNERSGVPVCPVRHHSAPSPRNP